MILPSGMFKSIPLASILPVPAASSSKSAFVFKVLILLPSSSISSTTILCASITLASKSVLDPSSLIITRPPLPLSCIFNPPK